MIKVMVLLHRRADVSAEQFRRHLRDVHVPLLRELPGLKRLVTNTAWPAISGQEPAYDGIGEDWFESVDAVNAAFDSPAGRAVMADWAHFLDVSRLRLLIVEEDEVPAGSVSFAGAR